MCKYVNVKIIVILLLIPIRKVFTTLIYTYSKGWLKLSRKSDTNTKTKMFKKTFFNKTNIVGLGDERTGGFYDDNSSCILWTFAEDEWDSIEGECEFKWGDSMSGGCNRGVNESKEDIWKVEDWENDTCEVGLWTIHLYGKCNMWVVAWDGRIVDVDEGTDRESASTCIGEDKTACDGRIDKDEEVRSSVESEGVIKETDELFVGTTGGRAKLNDAGSNGLSWMVLDQMALLMEILLIWCWLLV